MRRLFPTILLPLIIVPLSLFYFVKLSDACSNNLITWGNGTVALTGSGEIELKCVGFFIVNSATQGTIVEGAGEKIELEDGRILYIDFNGRATVSGDNMEVTCGGSDIYIVARLNGSVVLTGAGYYKAGLNRGLWTSAGVAVLIDDPDAR